LCSVHAHTTYSHIGTSNYLHHVRQRLILCLRFISLIYFYLIAQKIIKLLYSVTGALLDLYDQCPRSLSCHKLSIIICIYNVYCICVIRILSCRTGNALYIGRSRNTLDTGRYRQFIYKDRRTWHQHHTITSPHVPSTHIDHRQKFADSL